MLETVKNLLHARKLNETTKVEIKHLQNDNRKMYKNSLIFSTIY